MELTHVPYRGAGPALTDVIGGQVDIMFGTAAAVGSFVESGTLKAVAVTTAERAPVRPDVPTVAESGVPEFMVEAWYGLYAPAGTPPEVIARLNEAAAKAA
ncbi:tripartite tricarboxylate transporter substrate-binding protein, partial [Arthrospira platensis SPKY1]|nr:tripartite tricarboxylate transporter substrate-binding protein [Arthrospira platensis SPKY1]